MNAVISGRAGLALLIDGESLMSLDVDDLETLVPRGSHDLRFFLTEANDLVTLENTDQTQVAERLDLEHDIACALDMTLIALDSGASIELRVEAVAALDELLCDARVIERLEFTMYARPLPGSADLIGALFCTNLKTAAARSFFERLKRYQTAIGAVREAWDALPDGLFGDELSAKALFHDAACREGLFRLLALSCGDQAAVYVALLETIENKSIRSSRNHREVIQQWCAHIVDEVVADAPVIESQVDDHKETTEMPPPSVMNDRPRIQPADANIRRADIPMYTEAFSEAEIVLGNLALARETKLETLVKRIIAGDPRAEEELVRRYIDGLLIIIGRIVRNTSVAEDLSQESLMIAFGKIRHGYLRDPERLSEFMRAVARNRAIDYLRSSRSQPNLEEIGRAEQIPDPAPSPLEEIHGKYQAGIVRQLIDEFMSERDRDVLFRYYIAEEEKDQICNDLGVTRGQLTRIIFRARKRFRELYIKLLGETDRDD